MKKSLLCFLFFILVNGCGVKAPPVAPQRPPEYTGPDICSVYDPKCTLQDPGYIPEYNPEDPKALQKLGPLQEEMEKKRQALKKGGKYQSPRRTK